MRLIVEVSCQKRRLKRGNKAIIERKREKIHKPLFTTADGNMDPLGQRTINAAAAAKHLDRILVTPLVFQHKGHKVS